MNPKKVFVAWRTERGLDVNRYMDGTFTPSTQAAYAEWEAAYYALDVPSMIRALKPFAEAYREAIKEGRRPVVTRQDYKRAASVYSQMTGE